MSFTYELEHKVYWAINSINVDLALVGNKSGLELSELEEIRLNVYDNIKLYKEKVKAWHEKHITHKMFEVGQRIFLFNSHFKLFSGKFKSR